MTNFEAVNLLNLDPGIIWKAASGIKNANIVLDLGSANNINHIWLNNANFTACTIEANDSDAWDSPAVSKTVTLKTDDANITKGFFDLSSTNYRYVRVVIPSQTLLSGSELFLGNIIVGESIEVVIAQWQPLLSTHKVKFQADDGGYTESKIGKSRHVFNVNMEGTVQEVLYDVPWTWSNAITFEDMGSVERSFLVFSPENRRDRVLSPLDMQSTFTLQEYA